MVKRGQAALEFLTTYGWAFLVILVMIGALAYFGVLDPSKFVPDRCQFSAPLMCDGSNYKTTASTITFRLRNSLNKQYNVSGVTMKDDGGTYVPCTNSPLTPHLQVNPGTTVDVTCTVPGGITMSLPGNKQRMQMQVLYFETASRSMAYEKAIPGEIYAAIQ